MFPNWRLQLRDARRALREGRLDRACVVLSQDDLSEFRQAKELSAKLAAKFADRAREKMLAGQTAAGWRDLALAERFEADDATLTQMREQYAERSLNKAEQLLASGRTGVARQELQKLAGRKIASQVLCERRLQLEQLAAEFAEIEKLIATGNAAAALQSLAQMAEQCGPQNATINAAESSEAAPSLGDRAEQLRSACDRHIDLSHQLLAAADAHQWHEVLRLADGLLATAPSDRIARAARKKAWHEVGLDATQAYRPTDSRSPSRWGHRSPVPLQTNSNRSTHAPRHNSSDTMPATNPPDRRMMWVDAVGGFLVCLDDEILIGQPTPGSNIALPILADLSRRHAVLRREGGAYTLDPLGKVLVDGRELTGPTVLGGEHEIQLGSAVRLKFARPHALSSTARITIVSGHRSQPHADSILLMADSCVLGPKSHSHVTCKHWPGDVILFRQRGGLFCRASHSITVDGVASEGPARVECGTRLEGENLALSLENA